MPLLRLPSFSSITPYWRQADKSWTKHTRHILEPWRNLLSCTIPSPVIPFLLDEAAFLHTSGLCASMMWDDNIFSVLFFQALSSLQLAVLWDGFLGKKRIGHDGTVTGTGTQAIPAIDFIWKRVLLFWKVPLGEGGLHHGWVAALDATVFWCN